MNNKLTIYYKSYDEDVIKSNNQDYKISDDFKWIHSNLFYKICSNILHAIAQVFCFFYSKTLHIQIENKSILKEYKDVGYFVYANHTQPIGDAFVPDRVINKRFYTIASQSNLGIKFIGKILPCLGAIIIPEKMNQMKEFINAIKIRIKEKNAIIVYPESHVWPYYTKIRPFSSVAFKFPVELDAPSFCMTTTYYKRKNKKKPGIKIYVDGPFFPDLNLKPKQRQEKLCDEIYEVMQKRSECSTYEYIKYEKL